MITKRSGNGQTICKGCKDKGNFGLTWDSWLYNFNNEPYCFECLMEKLEELQQKNKQLKEEIKTFKNINSIEIIYLVIPTINGEIIGDAVITLSLDYDFGEITIYEINLKIICLKKKKKLKM